MVMLKLSGVRKAGKTFDYSDENGIYDFIETYMSNEFIFENKNYLNYSRRNLTKNLSKILTNHGRE